MVSVASRSYRKKLPPSLPVVETCKPISPKVVLKAPRASKKSLALCASAISPVKSVAPIVAPDVVVFVKAKRGRPPLSDADVRLACDKCGHKSSTFYSRLRRQAIKDAKAGVVVA